MWWSHVGRVSGTQLSPDFVVVVHKNWNLCKVKVGKYFAGDLNLGSFEMDGSVGSAGLVRQPSGRNTAAPMSPLAKQSVSSAAHRSQPEGGAQSKAALIPREVRKKAWATMRRGGQINVLASLVGLPAPLPCSPSHPFIATLPSTSVASLGSRVAHPTSDWRRFAENTSMPPCVRCEAVGRAWVVVSTVRQRLSIGSQRASPVERTQIDLETKKVV